MTSEPTWGEGADDWAKWPLGHAEGWTDHGHGVYSSPFSHRDHTGACGYFIAHRDPGQTEDWCVGSVNVRGHGEGRAEWDRLSEHPLTLTPSILQHPCELHGFITDGKWIPA